MGPRDTVIEQAMAAQRGRLVRLQGPVVLESPLDGFISAIHVFPGRQVTAGQPILVVSAGQARHLRAWVRQPVTRPPTVGEVLEVYRLGFGQSVVQATVIKVGRQMEPISPGALPYLTTTQWVEFG